MKILHYNLYNNGNVGMFNILMSVENALIIAKLTKRDKIIFYGKEKIFNSEKGLKIFDLFDVKYNYEICEENVVEESITSLPNDFFSAVLFYKETPSKDFINGRHHLIDLSFYENVEEIRTLNSNTLSFYSYLFYLGGRREEIVDFVKNAITPKDKYVKEAKYLVDAIIETDTVGFNSIHLRRADYTLTKNTKNKSILAKDFLPLLEKYFSLDKILVIHTDEKDLEYFKDIVNVWQDNVYFLDENLVGEDSAEKGLISALVASYSDDFIGTLFSTFTAFIQRYRLYNEKEEDFKFLFSQRDNLILVDGKFKEEISHGTQTWNRVKLPADLKQIAFWFREWQESYPKKNKMVEAVSIHPNFVTDRECDYLVKKAKVDQKEFFSHENRDRVNVEINSDFIISTLVKRACDALNFDYDNIENSMQLFYQHEGGETFNHCDSIYEDSQGRRVSSILFYLNDDFEGSLINFPYLSTSVKPSKGLMVKFPLLNKWNEQDKRFMHNTSIITSGEKIMGYFSMKEKKR